MRDAIVGYTGFVGSNIASSHQFTNGYHSTDITDAYGTEPDLLVYAGMPAEMFLANHYPEKDAALVENAIENIRKINPKTVVLISTIAVYDDAFHADEDTVIDESKLSVYGKDRLQLEKHVSTEFDHHLIVRLPALFGKGIKKNFIYDLIHVIPAMLTDQKFQELSEKDDLIRNYYVHQDNGFWKCRELSRDEESLLKEYFQKIGFSALNFTDSRSVYQYYNLAYLWDHICKALGLGIPLLNTATEPLSCTELYRSLYGKEFNNELTGKKPFNYDYRTKYDKEFGGHDGYIFDKETVKEDLIQFIQSESNQ